MDSSATQVSATLFALFAAIGSFWAAHAAWRSSIETRRASQAALVSALLDTYASNEMLNSLILLRTFSNKHGHNYAEEFRKQRLESWSDIKLIDEARRCVSHHFGKIHSLWSAGLIDENLVRIVAKEGQARFFLEVIEPLESSLNSNYDRASFEKFSRLHGISRVILPLANPKA